MRSRLNLITFASVFQKQEEQAIREAHHELFTTLDQAFDVKLYLHGDLDHIPNTELGQGTTVLFIATGGTEGIVVKEYDKLPKPTVLLTDGKANSLAASLELACWIRQKGDKCQIIHGDMTQVVKSLKALKREDLRGNGILKDLRIGVIGEPSDWLVSSDVDYQYAQETWGVKYVDIKLSEVERLYADDISDTTAETDAFINKAERCIEPNREEIGKAFRLYHALRHIADDYQLDALTIQCFSLIPTTHTTGCLALSLLNDEGIVAGCEGDLQSIFTLLLAKKATGIDGFMANPAKIDTAENSLIIAHCTIGLKQTDKYIIRSHFESQSGVAIQGILPISPVTIVKCGGKDLSRHVILTGHIIENQNDSHKCRTQLLIQLDKQSPVSYFLENNIGNHHIVLQGDHRERLSEILNK